MAHFHLVEPDQNTQSLVAESGGYLGRKRAERNKSARARTDGAPVWSWVLNSFAGTDLASADRFLCAQVHAPRGRLHAARNRKSCGKKGRTEDADCRVTGAVQGFEADRRTFEPSAVQLAEPLYDQFRRPDRTVLQASRPPHQRLVDLQILLMHRLEAWVTRRTTVEVRANEPAQPRLVMAGSDAKSYANVLVGIVGAWESLIQTASYVYNWPESRPDDKAEDQWRAFRASWPFFWRHLQNTAYCVAVSVWNEDQIASDIFSDCLVRWPLAFEYRLNERVYFPSGRFIYPGILEGDWADASGDVQKFAHEHAPTMEPAQLFRLVLVEAHQDTVLLTALLLLFWTINKKQSSQIGASTARLLLMKALPDDNGDGGAIRFGATFMRLIRLSVDSRRDTASSYSSLVDGLLSALDNMTERRVVPGRVFTPSTIHGRYELLVAEVALLTSLVPDQGDDGLSKLVARLAQSDYLCLNGDRALRDILSNLGRYSSLLAQPTPQLELGVRLLNSDREPANRISRMLAIVKTATATIEFERLKRLTDSPIDASKLEKLRSAFEAAILHAKVPFFRDYKIVTTTFQPELESHSILINGLKKAALVDPPMELDALDMIESYSDEIGRMAGLRVWRLFCGLPRSRVEYENDNDFIAKVKSLANEVGPSPLLVVSRQNERRIRDRYPREAGALGANVEIKDVRAVGGSYVVTIEGIDIFGADFNAGSAWLFSAHALQRVRYASAERRAEYLSLAYEPVDTLNGSLRATFKQRAEWTNTKIIELIFKERRGSDGTDV
jgi:hypothetical protein